MQCSTRASSPPKLTPSEGFGFQGASWSHVFQKSACMVEASPEESVTVPEVVGILKLALIVSVGTGMECVSGHSRPVPSLERTLRTMCNLWSVLSSTCWPFASAATQSGKTIRTPSTPPLHRVGGVAEPVPLSEIPHLHVMRAELITFRSGAKGLTCV